MWCTCRTCNMNLLISAIQRVTVNHICGEYDIIWIRMTILLKCIEACPRWQRISMLARCSPWNTEWWRLNAEMIHACVKHCVHTQTMCTRVTWIEGIVVVAQPYLHGFVLHWYGFPLFTPSYLSIRVSNWRYQLIWRIYHKLYIDSNSAWSTKCPSLCLNPAHISYSHVGDHCSNQYGIQYVLHNHVVITAQRLQMWTRAIQN